MFSLAVPKLLLFFAAVGDKCDLPGTGVRAFFDFPHWWEYLNGVVDPTNKCTVNFTFPSDILPVGLAIIDILLRLAGIVAVVSIVIAGVTYVTAAGSVDKATSARKRIINSVVGLAIVLVATAAVTFIGNSIQ